MKRNLFVKNFLSLIITLISVNVLFAQAPPTITSHPASRILPKGSMAIFSVAATGDGPITYQWRKNGTPILNAKSSSFIINSIVIPKYTYSLKDEGDYDCVVTNPHGSTISNIASLLVPQIIPFMKNDSTYSTDTADMCNGYPVTIKAKGGISYKWSTGETTSSITINPKVTSMYYVTITGSDFQAVDSSKVGPKNKLIYTLSQSLNLCNGQTLPITCTISQGTYEWQGGTTGAFTIGPITSDTAFYVTITKNSTQCKAYDSVIVGYSNAPAPIINLPTSMEICPGSTISAETVPTFTHYLWSNGDTTNTILPKTTGGYIITVTDANKCKASDNTYITIFTVTELNLGPDITMTADQVTILGAPSGMNTYLWNDGTTSQTIIVDGANLTIGNHIYSVTVSKNACEFIDSITITVKPGIGIEEINNNNLFNVYPNPTSGLFTIVTNNLIGNTIEIFTISGSKVFSSKINNNNENIDLSVFEKGLYIIKVSNTNNITIKKIILE